MEMKELQIAEILGQMDIGRANLTKQKGSFTWAFNMTMLTMNVATEWARMRWYGLLWPSLMA